MQCQNNSVRSARSSELFCYPLGKPSMAILSCLYNLEKILLPHVDIYVSLIKQKCSLKNIDFCLSNIIRENLGGPAHGIVTKLYLPPRPSKPLDSPNHRSPPLLDPLTEFCGV